MGKFLKKKNILILIVILGIIIEGFIFIGKTNKFDFNTLNFSTLKHIYLDKLLKIKDKNYLKSGISNKKCENIPELPDGTKKLVTKVIDGDTFLIEGGYSVRILGIDADEKGYPCYEEAKKGLEALILGKEVKLEIDNENLDQYCRYLRYVFVNDKNVSLEMIKNGLAVARFSPKNLKYREEIVSAEKWSRENKIGCKWNK